MLEITEAVSPMTDKPDQKKRPKRTAWRHPADRDLVVPYRAAAVVALMEIGISDYSVIANALSLTVEEVRWIDSAEDGSIRRLSVETIPYGEYFKLDAEIRCPKCNAMIRVVPCVACCGPAKLGLESRPS
ncbi:MAG: hypothetical protein A2V98_17025 [Planctomycetes bacterium RBG_16_64_12]|nr:MAG: hypothetical protein A2V98_17025 [Planctomycetes bacterium RBG_16_64_12]